jgi:hypothetical protein
MENSLSKSKFRAEQSSGQYEKSKRKTYEWVPKYELIAAFILIIHCMYFASIIEGWKGYLSNLVAIIILYLIISAIFDRITMLIESRDKEISNLRRQITGFICDTSLGRVSKADLKRIALAANDMPWKTKQNNLDRDDFNLISRAWFYWKDQNGFKWQDETECINCGRVRREHSKNGACPNLAK